MQKKNKLILNGLLGVVFTVSTIFLCLTAIISFLEPKTYMKNDNAFLSRVIILSVLLIHFFCAIIFLNNARLIMLEPKEDSFLGRKSSKVFEMTEEHSIREHVNSGDGFLDHEEEFSQAGDNDEDHSIVL